MLQAMREGPSRCRRCRRRRRRGRLARRPDDGEVAGGAARPDPNDPGGLGDASGVRMIERLSGIRGRSRAADARAACRRRLRARSRSPEPTEADTDAGRQGAYRGDRRGRLARHRRVSQTRRVRAVEARGHRDDAGRVLDITTKSGLRGTRRGGVSDRAQVVVLAEQRAAALHGLQLRRGGARVRSRTTCCSKRRRIRCSRGS
jgi:hypothetical protein